ncbi:unnamed protein product [Tetraodon nigroviridis]|uniref:(spotted green pufferfish) hypothetical protein n=1 Tax=Tetraodon nigroviridis TaxID=99883 RepID=Q4SME9_TETNG|nr:unnamed protein product [Tetraodon nigroviridis]
MYIKFCRNYEGDKKDKVSANKSPDSKLCVLLEGEKETEVKKEEKTQVYKKMCAVLSVVCLILLLVVIYLSIKSPTGSPACPNPKPVVISQTCSEQTCQALYNFPPKVKLPCEDDWSFFKGSCYFLSTSRKNWADSQRYCTSKGGSLAVISSPEVQDFLSNQGGLMYWIGLSQSNGIWTWVNNTVPETGQQGDCVFLQTKGNAQKNWIKGNCQQYSYFICQL